MKGKQSSFFDEKQTSQIRKFSVVLFFVLVLALIITLFSDKLKGIKLQADSFKLPYPVDQPNIGSVLLVYNYFGQFKEIKNTSSGQEVILDISDNHPPFIINKDTTRFFKPDKDGKPAQVSDTELIIGKNVNVQVIYDLKTKVWEVIRVDIF